MNARQHAALMTVIVPGVVGLVAKRKGMGEVEAMRRFIESRTYAALEDERSKVWHFSPETLYMMFDEEQRTGFVSFPEET